MHNSIKLALATVLLIGGTTAPFAEDATAAAGAAVDTAVDATTTGSVSTDFNSLLGNINAGAAGTASVDLSTMTDASTVNFVTISSLSGSDPAALDAAIMSQTEAMTSLHSSIEANAALKAKVEGAGYSSDDVLWIETGADGAFTVYVDDRA